MYGAMVNTETHHSFLSEGIYLSVCLLKLKNSTNLLGLSYIVESSFLFEREECCIVPLCPVPESNSKTEFRQT